MSQTPSLDDRIAALAAADRRYRPDAYHFVFRALDFVLDRAQRSNSIWIKGIDDPIHCPIAHGEGRYVHPDPESLAAAGQVALRYRSTNPNGSVNDIAGVSDPTGLVLGLMPHPENHIVLRQHPHHRRGGGGAAHLGLRIFEAGVAHAKKL